MRCDANRPAPAANIAFRGRRRVGLVLAGLVLCAVGAGRAQRPKPQAKKPLAVAVRSAAAPHAMVLPWRQIEGGIFEMGSTEGDDDEVPIRKVRVRTFELMQTEVTVAQYRACVAAQKCTPPIGEDDCNWLLADREDHPINCVDWNQAQAFAAWAGARLPTEAEWEFAARSGGGAQAFPWGDTPATCAHAVVNHGADAACVRGPGTEPVCSRPRGNSKQGLCDLAGNVWEWVADGYDPYPDLSTDATARGRGEDHRVFRGGSWGFEPALARATNRGWQRPYYRYTDVGVRLARDAPPPRAWRRQRPHCPARSRGCRSGPWSMVSVRPWPPVVRCGACPWLS